MRVAWMLEWRRREELERKKRRVGRQKARCGREGRTWGMYGGALLCAVGWEGVGRRGCVCGSSELGGMMEWFVSLWHRSSLMNSAALLHSLLEL
jgi:hypothetical protein